MYGGLQVHYVSLIDVFATCIVSNKTKVDYELMAEYCGIVNKTFRSKSC